MDLIDFAWGVTDGPTMHFEIAPCKVNGIRRLTEADGGSVNAPLVTRTSSPGDQPVL